MPDRYVIVYRDGSVGILNDLARSDWLLDFCGRASNACRRPAYRIRVRRQTPGQRLIAAAKEMRASLALETYTRRNAEDIHD